MTVSEYAQALLLVCQKDGSTEYVDALELKAREANSAGKGSVGAVTTASGNGKSVGLQVDLNPAQTILACLRASDLYNGTDTPQFVTPSFAGIAARC